MEIISKFWTGLNVFQLQSNSEKTLSENWNKYVFQKFEKMLMKMTFNTRISPRRTFSKYIRVYFSPESLLLCINEKLIFPLCFQLSMWWEIFFERFSFKYTIVLPLTLLEKFINDEIILLPYYFYLKSWKNDVLREPGKFHRRGIPRR